MKRSPFALVLAFAVVAAHGAAAFAANFFVSPCGQDIWAGIQAGCMAPLGPKRTIQAAINIANDGDTIFVLPGTYIGTINLQGKQIRIVGTGGAAATILDGDGAGPVVLANTGETAATIIEGLTIRGGRTATDGAGMLIALASPTIIDCIFEDNRANRHGGGIAAFASSPTITGTTFIQGRAGSKAHANGLGAGLYLLGGSPQVTDCTFSANWSNGGGGGVFVGANTTATISGSSFLTNRAVLSNSAGGGLLVRSGSAAVSNCGFTNNIGNNFGAGLAVDSGGTATVTSSQFTDNHFVAGTIRQGGGAWISDGSATFFGATFTDNVGVAGAAIYADNSEVGVVFGGFNTNTAETLPGADLGGGAIYALGGQLEVGLSQFTGNTTAGPGGAIFADGAALIIDGVNFTNNTAADNGGAVRVANANGDVQIQGVDFNGNQAWIGGALHVEFSTVRVSNCQFDGNTAGFYAGAVSNVSGDLRLDECSFTSNHASTFAGALSAAGHTIAVACDFSGNTSQTGGAVVASHPVSPLRLIGCRFDDNAATLLGGAIAKTASGDMSIVNSIISNNTAPNGAGAVHINLVAGGAAVVDVVNNALVTNQGGGVIVASPGVQTFISNSIIRNNVGGPQLAGAGLWVQHSNINGAAGLGNIDADPMFVDPATGDYRLQYGSPCIDAGSNDLVVNDFADLNSNGDTSEPTPLDFDGSPRFMSAIAGLGGCPAPGVVDMGPFEMPTDPTTELNIADLNGDGVVNAPDLGAMLGSWGVCMIECCPADLNGDGIVNAQDLGILLGSWGM